mmetsp:Transcript_81427/g.161642  ORF Transcript_81427/g.161642 Transcript_81427/m.161642 type:complete len:202 (+) Transcript_81427:1176-1781(+)
MRCSVPSESFAFMVPIKRKHVISAPTSGSSCQPGGTRGFPSVGFAPVLGPSSWGQQYQQSWPVHWQWQQRGWLGWCRSRMEQLAPKLRGVPRSGHGNGRGCFQLGISMDSAKFTSIKGTHRCNEQLLPLKPTGGFCHWIFISSGSLEGRPTMDSFQPQRPTTKTGGTHRYCKPIFNSKPTRGNCRSTTSFQAVAGGRLCAA